MLSSQRSLPPCALQPALPAAPSSLPFASERETRAMWSTTATGDLVSMTAANDDDGSLGFHAAACRVANGGIRRVIDTLGAIDRFLRSRLISAAVTLTLLVAVAAWIFG